MPKNTQKDCISRDFSAQYQQFYEFLHKHTIGTLNVKSIQKFHRVISDGLQANKNKLLFFIELEYEIPNDLAEDGLNFETVKADNLWSDLGLISYLSHYHNHENYPDIVGKRIKINAYILEQLEQRIAELLKSNAPDKDKRLIAAQLIYLYCVNHVLNNKVLNREVVEQLGIKIVQILDNMLDKYFASGYSAKYADLKTTLETGIQEKTSGIFFMFKQSKYQEMLENIDTKSKELMPPLIPK